MLIKTRAVANKCISEDIFKLIRFGFFAVNKRRGITCAEELEELKNAISRDDSFGQNAGEASEDKSHLLRAGHGGNLDSMATGVLAVALFDGCKILQHLLSSEKSYRTTACLGAATDTYNSLGKITSEAPYGHVTKMLIEEKLAEFVGEIFQKPPAYSALKIKGRRASDITRSGTEVDLVPRPVMCYDAECKEFDPPFFTLEVTCGKGFYVRSLVHDLAEAVGSCGHITELERTKHGPFTLADCLQPEDYSLDSVVSAVAAAQENHPELRRRLAEYWRCHEPARETKEKIKQHTKHHSRYIEKGRGTVL